MMNFEAGNQDTQPYKLAWWQVKERQQRQEAYSLLNNAFEQFSQGTGMGRLMDTCGRFDRYSPKMRCSSTSNLC